MAICCLPPNDPYTSPDMHEMNNATNSALDEINSQRWRFVGATDKISFPSDYATSQEMIRAKFKEFFEENCFFNPGVIPDFGSKVAKAYLEPGAEVLLAEYLQIKCFLNLEAIQCLGSKCPRKFNGDEWPSYYSRTKGVDSVLPSTAVLPDIDIKHMFKICKAFGPTTLIEVSKCQEYGRNADARKCEIIRSGQTGVNFVNAMEDLSASGQLYFMGTALRAGRQTASQVWYLDSGATIHVCDSKAKFLEYSPGSGGMHVVVANNAQADVAGIGTVMLILASGESVVLKDVLHVPTINKCLISVSKLSDDGFGVKFEAQKVEIYKHGRAIGDGYNERGMYRLNINNDPAGASTSGTVSEAR